MPRTSILVGGGDETRGVSEGTRDEEGNVCCGFSSWFGTYASRCVLVPSLVSEEEDEDRGCCSTDWELAVFFGVDAWSGSAAVVAVAEPLVFFDNDETLVLLDLFGPRTLPSFAYSHSKPRFKHLLHEGCSPLHYVRK